MHRIKNWNMKQPNRTIRLLFVALALTVLLSTTSVAAQPDVVIEHCSWWDISC